MHQTGCPAFLVMRMRVHARVRVCIRRAGHRANLVRWRACTEDCIHARPRRRCSTSRRGPNPNPNPNPNRRRCSTSLTPATRPRRASGSPSSRRRSRAATPRPTTARTLSLASCPRASQHGQTVSSRQRQSRPPTAPYAPLRPHMAPHGHLTLTLNQVSTWRSSRRSSRR